MEEKLKEYGLHVEWSEAEDREPIDFEIRDSTGDLYATVWGSEPWNDVQIDCNHDIVEYGDDDEQGVCKLCGATCDWHWENDVEDNYPDSIKEIKVRVPHEIHFPEKIGGIVGDYLKKLQGEW